MKATGIVRRIDDLGRVVIPKEIRRTMRIREGDPLEFYTDANGLVIFKKYSPLGELSTFASQYAQALSTGTDLGIIITDCDHFLAASGVSKKDVIGKSLTPEIEEIMNSRQVKSFDGAGISVNDKPVCAVAPVIAAGDITGSVILVSNEGRHTANDSDMRLLKVAASFLGKQMEQ